MSLVVEEGARSHTLLHVASLWTLGCDAADPRRLAAFWALALGYIDEPGYDDPEGASIVDPAGWAQPSGS